MSIESIFNVSVSSTSRTPSRAGFGTLLLLGYHAHFADRVRSYTSLAGMVSDGFATTEPLYQMAAVAFSQNPRPVRVKVGRCALPATMKVDFTPSDPSATAGIVYSVKINGTLASYTSGVADTLADVCTGLASAIDALALVTATGASGTKVVMTVTAAGSLATVTDPTATLSVKVSNTDPGIATDLAAVYASDPDWYGLALVSNSQAEALAAAAWAEANGKLLAVQSADSACLDGDSITDIAAVLKAAAYGRTAVFFHPKVGVSTSWIAAAMLASRMPVTPGSDTWAFKTLAGVDVYALTETQTTALEGKNANWYQALAGVNVTYNGKVAAGEWADVVRFLDLRRARQRERLFALQLASQKVPFTNAGISAVRAELAADIKEGQRDGGFDPDATPVITVPDVADVSSADRAARNLPGVSWSMRLAGAIHTMEVSGVATP